MPSASIPILEAASAIITPLDTERCRFTIANPLLGLSAINYRSVTHTVLKYLPKSNVLQSSHSKGGDILRITSLVSKLWTLGLRTKDANLKMPKKMPVSENILPGLSATTDH